MSTPLKKISCLFLLLLWFSPLLFTLVYRFERYSIRQRMKQKLEFGQLQTLRIPAGEVIWMDDHEIWVNDHMFDIHSKKLENGIFTFAGMYDKEETELMGKAKDATEKNKNENKALAIAFIYLLNPFPDSQDESCQQDINNHEYGSMTHSKLLSPFRKIPTPPPQA